MRKLYQPRFVLLLLSIAILLCCVFASNASRSATCTADLDTCPEEAPLKAPDLLWESFSHQFVSALVP